MRAPSSPPLRAGFRWRLVGLARLVRWLPVVSWIGGSIAIGFGAALGTGVRLRVLDVALIPLAGVLLQGLAAHAFNDREDWRSGTDPQSPGRLSGGSRVVPRGLLALHHLTWMGLAALAAGALIALYFAWRRGPAALALWLVAAWAAVAYSLPPLRLAYRPLLGEWLAAWPAVVAGAAGTFWLLTGRLARLVVLAGAVHGLFSLAWLMQHHLADLPADLAAEPVKLTTPAWLYRRGRAGGGPAEEERAMALARRPGQVYYGLAVLGSALAATGPDAAGVFWVPALLGAAGLQLSARPGTGQIEALTGQEEAMIALSLLEALSLALGLAGLNLPARL